VFLIFFAGSQHLKELSYQRWIIFLAKLFSSDLRMAKDRLNHNWKSMQWRILSHFVQAPKQQRNRHVKFQDLNLYKNG
jgi:hypothetical protein